MAFPCWIYHASEKPKIVQNDVEYAEHEATGWADSPAAFKGEPVSLAPDESAQTSVSDIAPTADGPQTDPATEAVKAEKEGLWAAAPKDVLAKLGGASKATLEKVKAYESERPKGVRKSVVAAVDAALAALVEE